MDRQDAVGRAYAGSQRQIQSYINDSVLTSKIDEELERALPILQGLEIEWRAPLAEARYAEPKDDTFWPAIERPDLRDACREWWPKGGPQWDAIAMGRTDGREPAVVLVEAKANVPELTGGDMGAKDPKSIALIEAALNGAIEELGSNAAIGSWTGPYYQLANRLAWTAWLRRQGLEAVFAHVLFENDATHISTSGDELRAAIEAAHAGLGIATMPEWAATVVLPAAE